MITPFHQPFSVYADTSVYGGVFDEKFSVASKQFFKKVRSGTFRLVVSALVAEELVQAPPRVRKLFSRYRPAADTAAVSAEAITLRRAYLDAGIVTAKSMNDALHVALATIAGCDLIVNWNFRHIVHFQKVPLYNAVNVLQQFKTLEIRSPAEVIEDE